MAKEKDVQSILEDEIRKRFKKRDIQGKLDVLVDKYFEKLDLVKHVKSYLDKRVKDLVAQYLDYLENGEEDPYEYEDYWDDQIVEKFKAKVKTEFQTYIEKTNPLASKRFYAEIINTVCNKHLLRDLIENDEGCLQSVVVDLLKKQLMKLKQV